MQPQLCNHHNYSHSHNPQAKVGHFGSMMPLGHGLVYIAILVNNTASNRTTEDSSQLGMAGLIKIL